MRSEGQRRGLECRGPERGSASMIDAGSAALLSDAPLLVDGV